jgi:hypothetical protein
VKEGVVWDVNGRPSQGYSGDLSVKDLRRLSNALTEQHMAQMIAMIVQMKAIPVAERPDVIFPHEEQYFRRLMGKSVPNRSN